MGWFKNKAEDHPYGCILEVKISQLLFRLARWLETLATPGMRRIDFSRIDLGKGKRQISPGGRLDKEFLITVPESFANVA
ncbi:type IV toxin-antitoxin system AbiEi family antitoxin domain-containing protein [Pseudomonas silesiensis]|uniref:type IV toxin-antitoxin system AbiEi family antitoxin domain-containing protein n=1 Tax=Pseudomonas silesiensis TaxID=1853130 RepID=UPI0030D2D68A